jgi:spore germination protein GerM
LSVETFLLSENFENSTLLNIEFAINKLLSIVYVAIAFKVLNCIQGLIFNKKEIVGSRFDLVL